MTAGLRVHQLKVHVQPNARKNQVVGMHGDALKIKVKAIPEDGKANAELCAFIAAELGIAKSKVQVIKGETSRQKTLAIEGVSLDDLKAVFNLGLG